MRIKTIKQDCSAEIVEKKSRFIANIFVVNSKEEAEKKINIVKKKYYDAKHNCFAFVVFEDGQKIVKTSDNGEPAGTAGMPILNVIEKNELSNILIVVTRYFGGILLGAGGLTRAYSNASIEALENAEIVYKEMGTCFNVELSYDDGEKFKYYCSKKKINISNIEYRNNIVFLIEVFDKDLDNLKKELDSKNKLTSFNVLKLVEVCRKYLENVEMPL